MRIRTGLVIAFVFALVLTPIPPKAKAFSGYASAPLSVAVTAISGGLRVTWSQPTDVDTGITGYRVEYSTLGTSGNWTLSATVSSSTYTADLLGLATTATYVRVAATTNSGNNIGTYGYPWTKLYGNTTAKRDSSNLAIAYETGYGLGGGDAAALNASSSFTRVRYRMDTTLNGVSDYAETDFYKWVTTPSTVATSRTVAPSISNLQIPVPVNGSSGFVIQANVDDLNVYSNNSNVTKTSGTSGRLEIWPWNYDLILSGLSPTGLNGKYDLDDTPVAGNTLAVAGGYGSFQVHNLTASQTVFAWNFHDYNTGTMDADVGYGNSPYSSYSNGHQDWTFCHFNNTTYGYCQNLTSFRIQIFINAPTTPLADTTAPTVTRVDTRYNVRNGWNITVKSTELGTAYLVSDSVTVTNVASITSATSSLWNSVSISTVNTNTTLTPTGLADGVYKLYASDSSGNLSAPVSNTLRMDTTPPSLQSAKVLSTGDSLQLTYNETMTNTGIVTAMYTISDGGSAITVTGYSINTNVITLSLSREISAGSTVTYSYTPTSGSAMYRWTDSATNEAPAISNQSVTNDSTFAVTATLSNPGSSYKGTRVTLSVTVSVVGKVTFTYSDKRIAGCIKLIASGSTPITVTCSWKPAVTGNAKIRAILYPTSGLLSTTYSNIVYTPVGRRVNTR